jgi:predicted ATP-dependent endonuclease of OLD family
MRIESLRIQNFRSFADETIHFSDYNCFVGPNGSGKSTILTALNILFRDNSGSAEVSALAEEDFHRKDTSAPAHVTVTFTHLSAQAKEDLKAYVRQDRLIVSAKAMWDAGTQRADVKQYGSRLVMPQFARYFKADKENASAKELKDIYASLREACPELPKVTSKGDMGAALRAHEEKHPELCELTESPDQFYGWSKGSNILAKYCQWVYVPAVKDAAEEQQEGKNTALGTLLQRTIRSKVSFADHVKELREDLGRKYREMIEGQKSVLKDVSDSIERRLQEWAHSGTRVDLQWYYDPDKSVGVSEPVARILVGEDNFLGEIPRMGHGLQRSFLVSLLQELAEIGGETQPTLILGFEEPELYQHPPQARHLASLLEDLSSQNAQVLVTTHSPYFVSGRGFESVRMTRRGGKGAASKVTHSTPERISEVLAAGLGEKPTPPSAVMAAVEQIMQPSQNELFFSRVPVLVEGVSDVAYISTYLKLTGRWAEFRRLGCHFVLGGGKDCMSRPLAIAECLGIPSFVIFDGDGDAKKPDDQTQHRKNNNCLLFLCGQEGVEPLPTETHWSDRLVMWGRDIEQAVVADVGSETWHAVQREVRESRDLQEGVKKKNTLLIAATLESAFEKGLRFDTLERLCACILEHARNVLIT